MRRALVLLVVAACWQDRNVVRYVIERRIRYTQCMEMDPPVKEVWTPCWNNPTYTAEQCTDEELLHEAEDGIHLREWVCANLKPCGVVCDPPTP